MTTRRWKSIGKYAVQGLCLLGVLCVLWSQVFVHDYLLWQLVRKYAGIKHPPCTRHIRPYKDLGLLIGNGNHCDLFVGELRSYTGSCQQVIDGYSSYRFWSSASEEFIPVEVLFLKNGKIENGSLYHGKIGYDMPSPVQEIAADARNLSTSPKHFYVVYIFDPGYDTGMDVRGW